MMAGATAQKGGNLMDDLGGCTGRLVWSNNRDNTVWETQTLRLQNDYVIPDSKTLIVRPLPRVTTTYYATCYQNDRVFPAANPKTIVITSNDCMRLDPVPVSVALGGSVSLTAEGCSGEVRWYNGAAELGRGRTLVHTPLPTKNPTQSSPVAYVYEAVCADPVCRVKTSVSVKACRFLITAAKTLAKIAEPVQLNSEGCDGGQVEWSTGEAGATVTVKPLQTAVYSAKCVVNGQTLCTSNELSIDVDNQPPADIECPSFTLQASLASVDKCAQQTVTITPNCPAGAYIVWENAVRQGIAEPYTVQLNDTKTITTTCTTIYGLSVTKEITIAATAPQLTVSPTSAVVGYPVTLTAYGCYTPDCNQGAYSWKNLTTGITYSGQNITVKLAEDTQFEVSCNGSTPKVVDIAVLKQCENSPTVTVVNGKSKLKVSANSEYDITWYRVDPITRTTSRSTEIYKNVSSITVPQPACTGTTNFYPWYKAVYVNESGAVCTDVFTVNCNNSSSGAIITQEPTTPDPCNQWAFDEKIKVNPYETVFLYSSWCPGKVRWYSDEARTVQVGSELSGGTTHTLGKLTNTTTFYDRCYLAGGAVCEGSYTINVNPKRAGTTEAIATTTASNCPPDAKISLAVAMEKYLSQMICQSLYLYQGDPVKAQSFLDDLQAAILSNPAFRGINISFPSNQSAIIAALVAGDCQKSAQLLSENNTGAIPFKDFNAFKNDNYRKILKEIINLNLEEIDISQLNPPTLLNITPTDAARVAAQNCEPLLLQYKTLTTQYTVLTKLPSGVNCNFINNNLIITGLTGSNVKFNGVYLPMFGSNTGKFIGFYLKDKYITQPDCATSQYTVANKPKPACGEYFLPKMWWESVVIDNEKGEFESYEKYKALLGDKAFAESEWKGQDAHWLTSDRENCTDRWQNACWNIIKYDQKGKLQPFSQIRDFYKWIRWQIQLQGHEVRWALGADLLVTRLSVIDVTPSFFTDITFGPEYINLLQDLNLGIANFSYHKWKELLIDRRNVPIIGAEAYNWDKDFIYEEQGIIAPPIYAKYEQISPIAIDIMNVIVHQENTGNYSPSQVLVQIMGLYSGIPKFDIFVSCTDSQYRIDLPLKMLYPFTHQPVHIVLKQRPIDDFVNIKFVPMNFCKP
ncbi:hypothetical protein [Runella sp.]|uniref:hypothetical protein n=1 Tax=Runella sp. TaxID=1960881 RepID=UPI003D0B4059